MHILGRHEVVAILPEMTPTNSEPGQLVHLPSRARIPRSHLDRIITILSRIGVPLLVGFAGNRPALDASTLCLLVLQVLVGGIAWQRRLAMSRFAFARGDAHHDPRAGVASELDETWPRGKADRVRRTRRAPPSRTRRRTRGRACAQRSG